MEQEEEDKEGGGIGEETKGDADPRWESGRDRKWNILFFFLFSFSLIFPFALPSTPGRAIVDDTLFRDRDRKVIPVH